MRKIIFPVVLLCLSLIFFSGCTAIKVSSQYSPSVMLDGSGDVNIQDFSHTPDGFEFDSTNGKYFKSRKHTENDELKERRSYLEPYQIYTFAGANPIYLDKSIDEFVTEAVKKELKFIGYRNSNDSHRFISGCIKELSIDYVGFSTVDFVARIDFKINDKMNNITYSKLSEGKYSSSKWATMDMTSGLYTALAKAIEDFVRSAQANGAL